MFGIFLYFVFAFLLVVFQVLISIVCFLFRFFVVVYLSICLKNIARLYVARRYFVVDKKKHLLDKLVELLQFYVEIVIFIRNQVC